jgi:citrate lyase beta subunit
MSTGFSAPASEEIMPARDRDARAAQDDDSNRLIAIDTPSLQLRLGASLYVPATRHDLPRIASGQRFPSLRSVIFCTEDAIRPEHVDHALAQLEECLPLLGPAPLLRFVRVRNPQVMARVLAMRGVHNLDGFVLPKTTAHNVRDYLNLLAPHDDLLIMPTLETAEAFDQQEMRELRTILHEPWVRRRVLALRIGANDLLNAIGVRRSPHATIYETAVGPTIAMLVGTFRAHGYHMTATVFEGLSQPDVLREEVRRDLAHGLFGKTAIHPQQIQIIENEYRPRHEELEAARAILHPDAPAVFRLHDAMCEPTTHSGWAEQILARAMVYGIADHNDQTSLGSAAAARRPLSLHPADGGAPTVRSAFESLRFSPDRGSVGV